MALKYLVLIDGGARRRWTWQAVIVTHHLNLNPFNNHRRSVHKARSTPCFLLLSLPWRSSNEMVPPPCISLPWTHAHANAHTALPLRDYFPWEPKGHCDDHELLEWNPSVPSPFIQSPPPPRKTRITRASPCCVPSRTKGRWWRRRERIRIAWRLWGETAIIWWFHFLQQSKMIRCWRRCRQVRSFLPTFTRRPWGSRLSSLKVFHPVAPPPRPQTSQVQFCGSLPLYTDTHAHANTCMHSSSALIEICTRTRGFKHGCTNVMVKVGNDNKLWSWCLTRHIFQSLSVCAFP